MTNYVQFWPAIRNEFLKGSTREEAFQNICQQYGLATPAYRTVVPFFDRFYDEDFARREERGVFQRNLRAAIIGQYLKFANAMSYRSNVEADLAIILENRFVFSVKKKLTPLSILDSFNNDTRPLQFTGDAAFLYNCYGLVQVDHDRVWMKFDDGPTEKHVLMKVDIDELKCSILATIELQPFDHKLIIDSMDCNNFALFCYEEGEGHEIMQRGRLDENRILMEDRRIHFNGDFYYYKLEGGKVFGFHVINENANGFDWQFCEYSPGADGLYQFKVHSIGHLDFFESFDSFDYLWAGSNLYLCGRTQFSSDSFMVIAFDAETHSWYRTRFAGMACHHKLSIDENDILSVRAFEYLGRGRNSQRFVTIYRFPMKKPEKLRYLAWATIRRGEMFFGTDTYKKFRLPFISEFLSFSDYSVIS